MHELMTRFQRHKIREMPIAPILDMMVAVIFFLLLSTTFIEYTKQTLRPADVHTTATAPEVLPLSPRLLVTRTKYWLSLNLTWLGTEPGHIIKNIANTDPLEFSQDLVDASRSVAAQFREKFPDEMQIHLSFGPDILYQEMISVMDGTQTQLPDIVLLSYNEANEVATGANGAGANGANEAQQAIRQPRSDR